MFSARKGRAGSKFMAISWTYHTHSSEIHVHDRHNKKANARKRSQANEFTRLCDKCTHSQCRKE